jgi:membrane protein DedA with SNARE-associated domain
MIETLSFSSSIVEWIPFAKGTGFFLATFILEDLAAVGAGLLLSTGGISWPIAFTACFLGIWMGDAGLYAVARYAGRSWFERSFFRRFSPRVDQSEKWFAKRGILILIVSRVIPGARLPTYLAAGFLRVPLLRFLLITGVASCAWTIAILLLTQIVGERLTIWFGTYTHVGLIFVSVAFLVIAILQMLRRLCADFDCRRLALRMARWRHWEFWPAWIFYPPVAVYCVWLGIKYRGLTVPTAANPGIFSGGIVGESKIATLNELFLTSPEFTAEAALVSEGSLIERRQALNEIRTKPGFDFPLIFKPDVGQRGAGVKLIHSNDQAEEYLRRTCAPLVVQRYVPGPHEVGVFYYRFPNEASGHIFAITEKIFPKLIGDGGHTISELILKDRRACLIAETYLKRFAVRQHEVLALGEELKLVEAGNHAQGCLFQNGERFCTSELLSQIDQISKKLTGFFIGRYDIRYTNEKDLRAGKNFQIIELNGAASEATSIYDARNSLCSAYQTLFRQWDLVFAIGAVNRRLGHAPTAFSIVWQKWREFSRVVATYPVAD